MVRQDPSKQSDGGKPSLQTAVSVNNMARARSDTGPLPSLLCALSHDTKQADWRVLVVWITRFCIAVLASETLLAAMICPTMQRAAQQAAEAECQHCTAPLELFVSPLLCALQAICKVRAEDGAYRSAGCGS